MTVQELITNLQQYDPNAPIKVLDEYVNKVDITEFTVETDAVVTIHEQSNR